VTLGWEIVTLADVLEQPDRAVPKPTAGDVPLIGVRLSGQGAYEASRKSATDFKSATLYRVRAGDFIYNRMWATRGTFAVVPPELDGHYATNEFPVFVADQDRLLLPYLGLVAQTPTFLAEVDASAAGSTERRRLHPEALLEFEIDLPPLDEQRRMMDSVSAADAAVERARAEQDALATLLRSAQEQLIGASTAEVVLLGDVAQVRPGSTPSRTNPAFFGGDVAWVKTGNIRFRDLYETDETLTDLGLQSCSAHVLPEGSVVLAMIGQGATRGRAAVLRRPMATNQNAAGIVVSEQLEGRFLFHWLWMNYDNLRGDAAGTSQPALNAELVSLFEFPLPSIGEQREIMRRLDVIHRTLLEAEKRAEMLKRVRASLIDSLLSGKRRVSAPVVTREAAARV
jgi:type I restriction enzyme S subunit